MSLYTIDQQIKATIDSLYDRVDENGELIDVTQEDLKLIEQLNEERKTKLENITLYCKNLDAEAAAIKAEEDALKKRRERIENKSEGLKKYMISSLMANGDNEFESPRCRAKIRESESTNIIDQSLIPEKYIKVKTPEPEYNPDKVAIKKAIKAGEKIPGAELITNRKLNIE
jgi:hypothetical protein